nr:uncharacterized protein LOC112034547 [Quercus suber]
MDFKSLNHGGISEILSRTRQASSSLSISSSTRDKLLLLLFLSGGNTVQKNAKAGAYINIVIDNWEDIKILCGRDRATGIGVEHMVDVVEVMAEEGENEVNSCIVQQPCQHSLSTSSAVEPYQRKRGRKDPLIEIVVDTSSSLLIIKNFRIIF